MNDSLCEKLRKLHALIGSDNAAEREAARLKISELLAKNKKTWNDLPELLSAATTQGAQDDPGDQSGDAAAGASRPAPLDLIRHILQRHLHLTEHQLVAMTAWIAHTFCCFRFSITPRLALVSPVSGCGKTTALNVVKALAFRTRKVDNITAAVLFRLIDRERPCVLLDEVDNLDLLNNPTLRAVITSGHHCDGTISRYLDNQVMSFSTFAPLALAAIGKPPHPLPLPISHRCVVISMERAPTTSEKLTRFDPKVVPRQQQDCEAVYRETFEWARQCRLNLDPPMPEELRNRAADNWRPLLAIADACTPTWGRAAREAAIALSKNLDEDLSVRLLTDVRDIFDRHPTVDRLSSAVIVGELVELADGAWSEWRGLRNDQMPRKLSQGGLALMLAPFAIRPQTIWPARRGAGDRSAGAPPSRWVHVRSSRRISGGTRTANTRPGNKVVGRLGEARPRL
jgi:Protein of unknown function (DUF3631)